MPLKVILLRYKIPLPFQVSRPSKKKKQSHAPNAIAKNQGGFII